jgi:hypothetical protein
MELQILQLPELRIFNSVEPPKSIGLSISETHDSLFDLLHQLLYSEHRVPLGVSAPHLGGEVEFDDYFEEGAEVSLGLVDLVAEPSGVGVSLSIQNVFVQRHGTFLEVDATGKKGRTVLKSPIVQENTFGVQSHRKRNHQEGVLGLGVEAELLSGFVVESLEVVGGACLADLVTPEVDVLNDFGQLVNDEEHDKGVVSILVDQRGETFAESEEVGGLGDQVEIVIDEEVFVESGDGATLALIQIHLAVIYLHHYFLLQPRRLAVEILKHLYLHAVS